MVPARELEPGPAVVVVSLPGGTIRGTVTRVQRGWTETVRLSFSSGAEVILMESAMVGLVSHEASQGAGRRGPVRTPGPS